MKALIRKFFIFILLHAITGSAAMYYSIEYYVIAGTVALWLMFIPTGMLLTRHREDPLTGWRLKLAYAWGVIFLVADVIANYTIMVYMFFELPDNDRKTVTARLKHYIGNQPESWRGKLAIFFCKYLIEPWDYGHCALYRLKH